MAEAVIALRAVDLTRQAFLSIQQSIAKLQGAIGKAGAAIGGFLTLQLARRALLGFSNSLRAVERDSQKFGVSAQEFDKVTRATGFIDSAMNMLRMSAVVTVDAILRVKDALLGVSAVESAGIADKIRAGRDAPRIKALATELNQMSREIAAIGETPAQHFSRLADEIQRAQESAGDPELSNLLNRQIRENEVLRLTGERRKIAIKIFNDYEKSVQAVADANDAFAQKSMTVDEQQTLLASDIERTTVAIEELQSVLQSQGEVFDLGLATQEQIDTMEQLTELQREYVSLMGRREVVETAVQKIARQSGEIISQSLEDAIFAGNKLSEVLRNLAQDLLRMAFREAVTAPLGTGLGSFFKNLFRAEGGPVASGSPYIVGERGPELFVPRSSGSIVSNDNLSGMGAGGGGINITYNIASGVGRAELGSLLEAERRRLKAEIPDMVRRGGAYRAAFA